jgi:hypothetical protein
MNVFSAQRLALAAWGGRVDSPSKREKLKVTKKAQKRGAYPKSAARYVGRFLTRCTLRRKPFPIDLGEDFGGFVIFGP